MPNPLSRFIITVLRPPTHSNNQSPNPCALFLCLCLSVSSSLCLSVSSSLCLSVSFFFCAQIAAAAQRYATREAGQLRGDAAAAALASDAADTSRFAAQLAQVPQTNAHFLLVISFIQSVCA